MTNQTVSLELEGGDKLQKYLHQLAIRLGQGGEINVGFLEDRTYPREDGGMPVAQNAFWQEYGTPDAKHPIPPRPFFRRMIADQKPTWARKLGVAARYTGYRAGPTLEIVAADIRGHLVGSINSLMDPPLSEYTKAKKGFDKPLIETDVLVNSPNWEVKLGRPVK